jgi:type IV pilus assembly protein PilV
MNRCIARHAMRGATMIEVLVTIVILAIGLLGIAGLETRLQSAEMEAYQRAQALILVNDMASRISTNRTNAPTYVTDRILGLSAANCPSDTSTRQKADAVEWCNALQGAGETTGGNKVGVMLGGRGCVENLGNGEYLVTVAWQGLGPVSAPPAGVACGQDRYDNAGACAGDVCRRAVTTVVRIADLSSVFIHP